MGKGKRCFRSVKTKEDRERLRSFEALFTKNYIEEVSSEAPFLIPPKIHFIWLGPNPYPEKSKQCLSSWQKYHPDWPIYFWSDHPQKWLPQNVEFRLVETPLLGSYAPLYEKSDNFGEKSDLLRLILLQKEGGLYVDHDVECRSSFAHLHKKYDFYAGLQTVGNHILQSSAVLRNSIIGVTKNHPIIALALAKTEANWGEAGKKFPGNDLFSLMSRVTHRAFLAFHEAVVESMKDPSFKGIIFPAGYFNEIGGEFGLYTHEEMTGSWYRGEMNYYEDYLHKRMHKLMKRLHLFILLFSVALLLNFSLLFFLWRSL